MTSEGDKAGVVMTPQEYNAIISACSNQLQSLVYAQLGALQENQSKSSLNLLTKTNRSLTEISAQIDAIKQMLAAKPAKAQTLRLESLIPNQLTHKTYKTSLVFIDKALFQLAFQLLLRTSKAKKYELIERTRPRYVAVKLVFSNSNRFSQKNFELLRQAEKKQTIFTHENLDLIVYKLGIRIITLCDVSFNISKQTHSDTISLRLSRSQQLQLGDAIL